MEEIFKKIPNYEKYSIGNMGTVLSFARPNPIKRKLKTNKFGYIEISLYGHEVTPKTLLVHRLVAESFVSGKGIGLVVNHKDGNKSNNVYSNLEWVTPKENVHHAISTGLVNNNGENHPSSILKESDVLSIVQMRNSGKTARLISLETGLPFYAIKDICAGKSWVDTVNGNIKKFRNSGDRHSIAKINSIIARNIVESYNSGSRIVEISNLTGLSRQSVSDIVRGRTWREATGL